VFFGDKIFKIEPQTHTDRHGRIHDAGYWILDTGYLPAGSMAGWM